jgi:hypothetical protein
MHWIYWKLPSGREFQIQQFSFFFWFSEINYWICWNKTAEQKLLCYDRKFVIIKWESNNFRMGSRSSKSALATSKSQSNNVCSMFFVPISKNTIIRSEQISMTSLKTMLILWNVSSDNSQVVTSFGLEMSKTPINHRKGKKKISQTTWQPSNGIQWIVGVIQQSSTRISSVFLYNNLKTKLW